MKSILFISFALFTGAIAAWAQEPADTLQDVRPFGTHVLEMLTAREPGVEVISSLGAPGMTPTIHIRGLGVLPGIEPVYVVDGMRRRTLDGIAPESIEKIEVLKDAAAMGLWGPDAAAGVVVVTTRRASRKGFHAGYDFVGGVQSLTHVPEKMTMADWQAYEPYRYTEARYKESDQPVPETAFLQRHHLYAQYGGEKLSAYAGFSMLDNDGPYPGKDDIQRRYAASWSAEYRPVRWLSLETTGRWGKSVVENEWLKYNGWLQSYLVSQPVEKDRQVSESQSESRDGLSETVVQGKLEVRPLPGLYVRGVGGYAHNLTDVFLTGWSNYAGYPAQVNAKAGYEGKRWYQWGAEAGWSGAWRGHRLRLDGAFRRMKEKQDNHVLGGICEITDYGLSFGDDTQVVEKYLDPAYEIYLAEGGGLVGFEASKLNYIKVSTPEMKWKEGVLTVGYDWKGRYEAGFSYHRVWEEKLFSGEGYRTPAITLGWNLSEEPLLRRVFPTWWKDWSVKASWSETKPFIPLFGDLSMWRGQILRGAFNSGASTDARHRDLTSHLGFQFGKTALDLAASWFINDDGLTGYYAYYYTGPGVDNQLITGDKRYFDLRNRGVEFSGDLRGEAGPLRYSVSAYMTFYGNRVTFGDAVKGLSYFSWLTLPVALKDGEPLGGIQVAPLNPETFYPSYDDAYWTGSAFPTMTGGLRVALGWKHWQFTASGHGDRGQTVLHHNDYDALIPYYLKDYRRENNPEGKYAIVEGPDFLRSQYSVLDASFFRIDQIRLDYAFPFRGVRLDLFASMENAFLFTRYPGTDPELALAWQGFGYESATYPSTRRVLFGVKVGF